MLCVYSDDHRLHDGLLEPAGDAWAPSVECPVRVDNVLAEFRDRKLGEIIAPRAFGDDRLTTVHDPDYVAFLRQAWNEWIAAGHTGTNAKPFTFVGRGMRYADTQSIQGKLGRYSFGQDAPFVAGSWHAIHRSAETGLTGADLILEGQRFAFSLCRPPGHHASAAQCGGYCYLNNTALAAQSLIDAGMDRVAIIDVDYHHGNGTQSIFYQRNDVLTISLHADPSLEYPYFSGFGDERGSGVGEGFNHNYPMPFRTNWDSYSGSLDDALKHVRDFAPAAVIVALGLDTFDGDPISRFAIQSDDYLAMGRRIATLNCPTLVVLEGGYAVDAIGNNATNFLQGIEDGP